MQFDTTLNLVWLALGLIALGGAIRAVCSRTNKQARKPKLLNLIGVCLIIAALFPYISATDDVLTIEHYSTEHNHTESGSTAAQQYQSPARSSNQDHRQHNELSDLIRLYETMDTPLVCRISEIVLVFLFFSLVLTPVFQLVDREAPIRTGRSPPQFA